MDYTPLNAGFFGYSTLMSFKISKIHHIKLTVRDLNVSKGFYGTLPGFKCVAEYPDFVMFFVGNFYLGLTTHNKTKGTFDETVTGLDHVSFEVASEEELYEALAFFEEKQINHDRIEKLSNGLQVLVFRDPDNIQLELTYKPT